MGRVYVCMYFRYYFKCQHTKEKLIIRNNVTRLICWQIFNEILPLNVYSYIFTIADTGHLITSIDCIAKGRTYCIQRLPSWRQQSKETLMGHPFVRYHRRRRRRRHQRPPPPPHVIKKDSITTIQQPMTNMK